MPATDDDATTEILTHQFDLLRVAAGLRADAVAELETLEAHLVQALQNKGEMSVNKAAKFEALLKQTQGQISDAYKRIGAHHGDSLKSLAVLEGAQSVKVVNARIGASVVSVAIAPKLLEAVVDAGVIRGHSSATWWQSQAADLTLKFSGQMRQGVLLGESVDELARRVRGTKANSYNDGIMAAKKREAAALVRSSVIAVANEARLRSFREMGDVVKGIAWLSTLDGRTTTECRGLDGLEWTLEYEPVGHDKKFPGPTAHWQCRSTQTTVLRSWDELSGKKLPSIGDKELEAAMQEVLAASGMAPEKVAKAIAGTRASMDGQVSASMDYNEWLATKSDAFINDVLGPGRAALWKSGKVTLRDLTDQDNRPLTLKQLAEKIQNGIPAPETLGVQWVPQQAAAFDKQPDVEAPPEATKQTPEEIEATAALATQVASKTWSDLAKAVLAEMPDASPIAQLATFEARKLAKQQATMLNDTAAMNVAKGWVPPVTKTLLNKLADDDPAKLAFFDKVALAKAKLDAETAASEATAAAEKAAAQQAAMKESAKAAIEEFKKQSPEHANAADFVLKLYPDPTEAVAELQKQLDSDAKVDLETMAAGGKGVSLIAKAKAAQLLKANPDAGYKELQTVQATVAASIAAGSKTAAVNGALKASIAGKKLNAKQQAALDELSPEEKSDFDSKVEAGKATPAATAAATIATAPDAKVQNLAQDVPDVASMTFVKTLPGSTSPGLYEDAAGKLWVVKKASATSLAHVASESLADAIYRAAGARVPFSTLTKDGKETLKVAEFIPDAKTIGEAILVKFDTAAITAAAQNYFVLDALLGNWDAVGTGKNNMLVDPAGNLWRIDNGGALAWRAMGTPKDAKWLTPEVQELQTLLNPALNRDAASIYKGITTDEIHRQIREIIDRRAAILSAAEPDPKSRKLLAERIDYLETLLPSAMVPAKAASPTAAIPANIATRIAKARSAGVALRLGANQVEDNNAIVWAERGLDGKDGVRVQLKVTQAGSNDIMAKLKQANVVGVSASASGAVYVQDPDWATIEQMAKHIGFHAGKGTLNPTKLAELPALRAKYQSLAKSKDPVEAATGKYYTELLNDLADAKIDNAKPKKLWKSFNSMVDTDPALAFVKAPKATAPPVGKELQGWAIKRLDTWDTYQTKIGKDGIPERTALANPDLKVIEGYELVRGSVRLRFTPQIGLNAGGMRAMHGTIQVWVNGTQMDTGTAQAVAALKELGIDTDEPNLAQQELTYLHKGWYQHNKHTTPEYAAIYGNAALPIEEKLKQIRALSEKTFKVKLPKSPEDWNDDYDPRGFNDASDGTGYRVYYRWDVPRSKMEKEMKGYTLNHFSAHMMDAVKGWLAAGRVTPTYDRIRTGVEVRHGLGMSPLADMDTGGAVGFFNSVTNQPTNKGKGAGFRWKVRNLARLDSVNLGNDSFGRFEAYADRYADVATFKKWKTLSRKDQAMLKNGMSFVDELEHIWAESSKQRKAIIDEFKKAGYAVLPDGRKIEDVVTSIK